MSEPVAYLLGELSSAQNEAFERAMAADAALREEVERLRPVVTRLEQLPAEAWEDAEPPPLSLPEVGTTGGTAQELGTFNGEESTQELRSHGEQGASESGGCPCRQSRSNAKDASWTQSGDPR